MNTGNDSDVIYPQFFTEISWPRPLRYSLLLLFDIPAIACSLFILFHLVTDRSLRQALNNHPVSVSLFLATTIQLIDIPCYIDFARNGVTFLQTPAVCLLWWFVDIGCYNSMTIMFAWTSVERHILIFHDRWLLTFKKRLLIHYIPLMLIILYLALFYLLVIFAFPCENEYIYTLPVCGNTPCYSFDPIMVTWDIAGHGYLPTILVILANTALFFRVVFRRQHLRQGVEWRKYRTMIIQMLSIAGLYIPFSSVSILMDIMLRCGVSIPEEVEMTAFFLTYWVPLLLPFVFLLSLPTLKSKVKSAFSKCPLLNRNRVTVFTTVTVIPQQKKAGF